ncbi:TraR/DksA family transcriptional regulator [Caryophanon latum]|mgnify:CR=1 FL=1|uniref:Zinc finger DksA/TraR C4-type domain-containing protein n=1 Tax=Caryophanon latum TaxID=33977 RepID=A0A1C0Z0D7_9BACL|nr:TraR/DksA C4-type zinc finger protein [Caryophanon latum]OCS92897.1 hypothetical protein A6K76_05755 [Caryophanon latum]
MTEQQLQALQARLVGEKESILASNALHEGEEELEELEGVDHHPADQGTELAEEYVEQALEEQRDEELKKIDAALAASTYGICTVCGEVITYERLEALPTTRTCITHAI